MKPVEFTGCNVLFGADQPEYLPLPALRLPDGDVITCWEITDEELSEIVKTKRIYFSQLTFYQALQPILPMSNLSVKNITLAEHEQGKTEPMEDILLPKKVVEMSPEQRKEFIDRLNNEIDKP